MKRAPEDRIGEKGEPAPKRVKLPEEIEPALTKTDKHVLRLLAKDFKEMGVPNDAPDKVECLLKLAKELDDEESTGEMASTIDRCQTAQIIRSALTFVVPPRAISAMDELISKSGMSRYEQRSMGKKLDDQSRYLRVATFTDDGQLLQKIHIQRDTGKGWKKHTVTDIAGALILTTGCSKKVFRTIGVIDTKRGVCTIKGAGDATAKFKRAMSEFAEDPEKFLCTVGKKIGECCMCGRPLSDDRSKERGFGPVCYKSIQRANMRADRPHEHDKDGVCESEEDDD